MEKVVNIKSLHDKSNDYNYWMSKTDQERLEAIEFLRLQYIKYIYKDVQPRLQRVCRIINKQQS